MKKAIRLIALLLAFNVFVVWNTIAQETPAYAITNVTIHHADGAVVENGTIVWRNGVIESIGSRVSVPFDAYEIDGGDSLHVYPGFIDGLAMWGSPDLPKDLKRPEDPGNPGYERAGIQPERIASEHLNSDDKALKTAMEHGFTTAALGFKGYMMAGQPEIFMLSNKNTADGLYKRQIGLQSSFDEAPGGWSNGAYPSTVMGVMARFKQLMFDAEALMNHLQYFEQNPEMTPPNRDAVLESLFPVLNQEKPVFFEADTRIEIEKMLWLKAQFDFDVVLVSGKEAYTMADELARRDIPVLASVELPDAPEWYAKQKKDEESDAEDSDDEEKDDEDSDDTEEELTEEEQHYRERQLEAYLARVQNIKNLREAGVKVGFSSNGLKLKELNKHIKVLLDEGELSEEELLTLMTTGTAEILGIAQTAGTLEEGNLAAFSVFTKPFTEEKTKVKHVISNGVIYDF